MKTKSIIAVSCFLLLLSIFSCTNPKSKLAEYGPVLENVMQTDNGAFRGFSLGEAFDTIQKTEQVPPVESDENYLYYEYSIDTIGTYNVAYNFEEKALNEIQSDIFINNSSKTEEVYNSFKKYFDLHYGVCEDHMGFAVWTVKSAKYGDVRINLSDESADFTIENNPGKISIWIYPDKN